MAEKDIPRAAGGLPSLVTPAAWEAMRQAVSSAEIIPDPTEFHTYRRGKKMFFRLRPPGDSLRDGPPPFPPFLLSASTTGARYYKGVLEWCVTRLTFEKKYIYDKDGKFLADVNGLVSQDEIDGVKVMEVEGESSIVEEDDSSGPPADDWRDLDWFGDVWAVVELDGETGEPVALTIEGPEEPEMQPITKLNEDLARESQSAGGSGSRIGYAVKIGTVPETGAITQDRTGNLQWFLAFVPENESSSSGSGESSSGSSSGSSGGSGSGSSKDTAIVPTPWGFRKWYAMESAEVLFFDFMEVEVKRGVNVFPISPMVLYCVERSTLRAFASPERGHAVVKIEGDELVVRARHWPWPRTQKVQVMLKAVRRGFDQVRNELATREDYIANEMRLCPNKTREQVETELDAMPRRPWIPQPRSY